MRETNCVVSSCSVDEAKRQAGMKRANRKSTSVAHDPKAGYFDHINLKAKLH